MLSQTTAEDILGRLLRPRRRGGRQDEGDHDQVRDGDEREGLGQAEAVARKAHEPGEEAAPRYAGAGEDDPVI